MFGTFGGQEMLIVLLIILLLFGPRKLPELARSMGEALGEFKRAQRKLEMEAYSQSELSKLDRSKLEELAKKMGIDPTGKSTEDLALEIAQKAAEISKAQREEKEEEKKEG